MKPLLEQIMAAVRGHRDDITAERVILWADPEKPGNALSQLQDRLMSLLSEEACTPADLLKQSAERMMRGEPPPADEQPYDIWVEGYNIQGEKGAAHHITTIVARSFQEACLKAKAAGALDGHGNFDEGHLTLWGAKLFPTESEARKNFG